MASFNYIDIFAGAGGLSEGFIRERFTPIAHVEMNKSACDTITTRVAYHYLKSKKKLDIYHSYLKEEISKSEFLSHIPKKLLNTVINSEISNETISTIFEKIEALQKNGKKNKKDVDVIIGGPPCQAYSIVGRARDPKNMEGDPRNFLYKLYVKFLKKFQPKMFVFENVPGILSAKNGEHFTKILKAIKDADYDCDYKILNTKDFGVLQDRKRVIIIGWKKVHEFIYPSFKEKKDFSKFNILKDLFFDLPKIKNGKGSLGAVNYKKESNCYLKDYRIRNGFDYTTQHIARPNNENDLDIYRRAVEKWKDGIRLDYDTLPDDLIKHKNRTSFKNRFQVVNGKGISHTVVAHIAMDGNYYIHPDIKQNRSITIREAARIQSFPDDYFFEGGRTAAFKQIGNAVPPLMAEKIANEIKKML